MRQLNQSISILEDALKIPKGTLDLKQVAKNQWESVARLGAFGSSEQKTAALHYVCEAALNAGIVPASIHHLYAAIGRGEIQQNFTVPAINVRAIAFNSARGVFQAMHEKAVGAVIFELSRGEIRFTNQRPAEYTTSILCAAIYEGYCGPIFFQGDHFQVSLSQWREDAEGEIQSVEALIREAIAVGFYNIDIDTSTLVDLSRPTVLKQQQPNFELCARLTKVCREAEPEGVTISIGGEIGEVGEHNTTAEEVDAFMQGFSACLPAEMAGLAKLSVQSGTRHGGNIMPDGTTGDMNLDFDLLKNLGKICREHHKIGGVVQHGASTLPMNKFVDFVSVRCLEVHLAASFLNIIYDSLPQALKLDAYQWLKSEFADEWRSDMSEAQFIYHARRYPVGPYKRQWWDLPGSIQEKMRVAIRHKACEFFQALNVQNTSTSITKINPLVAIELAEDFQVDRDIPSELIKDLAD